MEPMTVNDIAHGANLTPILFNGEEEEEFLPHNLWQPIPDTSNNDNNHMDFTPLEDPDQSIDHVNLNDHADRNEPDGPQRLSWQKHGMNEPSRLEKAV